jgi:hypothetical protein
VPYYRNPKGYVAFLMLRKHEKSEMCLWETRRRALQQAKEPR